MIWKMVPISGFLYSYFWRGWGVEWWQPASISRRSACSIMQAVIELEDAIVSRTTPTLTLPRSTRGGDKRSTRGGDKRRSRGDKRSSRGRDKKALYDRPATIGRRAG